MSSDNIIEHKKFECPTLPKGWFREEIPRSSGLSAGKTDVFYYSPSGKKVRNKQELNKILGDKYELDNFDFQTGTVVHRTFNPKKTFSQYDFIKNNKSDSSLLPPVRQTASIFKQPVTILNQHPSQPKSDTRHPGPPGDKPRQLFWERRLAGIAAFCPNDENFKLSLPSSIKSAGFCSGIEENILLASISTALHMSSSPVIGQVGKPEVIETNPGVFINPKQPLMEPLQVSQDDISAQEERVSVARQKLADAMEEFS